MKLENNLNENQQSKNIDKKANKLTFYSMLLLFGVPIICSCGLFFQIEVLYYIASLSFVIGLSILIYIRVEYPKHTLSKIVLSIVIVLICILIVVGICVSYMCIYAVFHCNWDG